VSPSKLTLPAASGLNTAPAAVEENRPLDMRWKKAWVATDWNGTMGGYEMKLCWMLFWVDCLYPA
jgi:hypothetical protein